MGRILFQNQFYCKNLEQALRRPVSAACALLHEMHDMYALLAQIRRG